MLRSLDSGVSALQQFQQEMDVIGNNIANVDTVGYKGANVSFADTFSQTLGSSSNGSMQVGTGVLTASISNDFTQGTISNTGVKTDMAVNGDGFFVVKDSTSNAQYVTRDGHFTVDTSGNLVTSTGMHVQGYSDAGLTTLGDIKMDNTGATMIDPISGLTVADTSAVSSFSFGTDGKLTVMLADGTSFTRGQVLLQNFTSPGQLMKAGNNLFSNLAGAGPLSAPIAPGTSGLGSIVNSSLEMSNVDLASAMASMITTQRAFEASGKIVTTSDEILQTLVNLKR
jgi:flagellar hook protein FlgE